MTKSGKDGVGEFWYNMNKFYERKYSMIIENREMIKEEKMLSIEASAEELGTSLKQIRRYVASGQLAAW